MNNSSVDPMLCDMRNKTVEALQSANAYLESENKLMNRTCKKILDLEEALRARNIHLASEHAALVQVHRKLNAVLLSRMGGGRQSWDQDEERERLQELHQVLYDMGSSSRDPSRSNMQTEQAVRHAQENMQSALMYQQEMLWPMQEHLNLDTILRDPVSLSGLGISAAAVLAERPAMVVQPQVSQHARSRALAASFAKTSPAGPSAFQGFSVDRNFTGFSSIEEAPDRVAPYNAWQDPQSTVTPSPEELFSVLSTAGTEGYLDDLPLEEQALLGRFSL